MELTKSNFGMMRAMVAQILKTPLAYDWSIQGFGMLRLHLSDAVRLNIWDSRFRVPNVSLIHTHPWDFESVVVSGRLENVKYYHNESYGRFMYRSLIKPGPGGGIISPEERVRLQDSCHHWIGAGHSYFQKHDEIHASHPDDGCVTLNYRTRVGPDEAYVFWPSGERWVSAEPRKAKVTEIVEITENAAKLMMQEQERGVGQ